jgi:hypothetical protein
MLEIDTDDYIIKGGRKIYGFTCQLEGCKNRSYRRKDQLARTDKKHYCSLECSTIASTTAVEKECDTCGALTIKQQSEISKSKSGLSFCSSRCSGLSQHRYVPTGKEHYNYIDGSYSYRQRALRHFEHKCHNPDCIVTPQLEFIPVEMLDVDHIDNNRSNNVIGNLIILCVWCHTLKTRNVEIVED